MARNARGMKPAAVECTSNYVKAYDYDADGYMIYAGRADPGTAQSEAGWLIEKFTWDSDGNLTDIQFEGGNASFDAIWDDRTSLSYS